MFDSKKAIFNRIPNPGRSLGKWTNIYIALF